MPQSKILVDTNAYLRLAKTIRPLLFMPFGDNEYCLYIAYALELSVPVVTDDQDMTQLAKAFDAQVMPTLELLRIMLDSGHTDKKTISGLIEYWKYFSDMPANFKADYRRLFGDQ